MENGTFHKFSITLDAYPFLLFINAGGSHLMIFRHCQARLTGSIVRNAEYSEISLIVLRF